MYVADVDTYIKSAARRQTYARRLATSAAATAAVLPAVAVMGWASGLASAAAAGGFAWWCVRPTSRVASADAADAALALPQTLGSYARCDPLRATLLRADATDAVVGRRLPPARVGRLASVALISAMVWSATFSIFATVRAAGGLSLSAGETLAASPHVPAVSGLPPRPALFNPPAALNPAGGTPVDASTVHDAGVSPEGFMASAGPRDDAAGRGRSAGASRSPDDRTPPPPPAPAPPGATTTDTPDRPAAGGPGVAGLDARTSDVPAGLDATPRPDVAPSAGGASDRERDVSALARRGLPPELHDVARFYLSDEGAAAISRGSPTPARSARP